MERSRSRLNRQYVALYMLPAFAVLAALVLVPLIQNVLQSFTVKGVFPSTGHYQKLMKDRYFLQDIRNTFTWLLYTVPLEMVLGLTIAVLLNMKIRFRKLFRTIFMIPWVIPAVVVCIIWKWIYNADYGILNHLLYSLNVVDKYQLWVSNPKQVLACIAAVYAWKISPFVMIMYLSGLQSISVDIYEAAQIDGASWFTQVFKITIPLLFPVMRSVLLVSMIWSLNSFVYVYAISRGGPSRASELVQIFIYKTGIEQYKFGYSAAAANVFLLIVMTIALVYIVVTEKREATLM